MSAESVLNIVFFAVGLAIGLFQLYLAQHQFEVQQREKMDELRKILTDIQQRLAVLEETSSDRVFAFQDKLLGLIGSHQAVEVFTEETTSKIQELIEFELRKSGVRESVERTKSLEKKVSSVLERSASALVEHASGQIQDTLTIRQAQIIDLVVKGLSVTQIAESLGVSVGTVKVHLATLFRFYGVTSREELVSRVMAERRA